MDVKKVTAELSAKATADSEAAHKILEKCHADLEAIVGPYRGTTVSVTEINPYTEMASQIEMRLRDMNMRAQMIPAANAAPFPMPAPAPAP